MMIIDQIEKIKDTLEETLLKETIYTNLGKTERIISMASGAYILFSGVRNVFSHPLVATAELVLGYGLLQRGISGYSSITEKIESEANGPEPILIVG